MLVALVALVEQVAEEVADGGEGARFGLGDGALLGVCVEDTGLGVDIHLPAAIASVSTSGDVAALMVRTRRCCGRCCRWPTTSEHR